MGARSAPALARSRARSLARGNNRRRPWRGAALKILPRCMDRSRLAQLLQAVSAQQVDVATALSELSQLPFSDLSYARVDDHRALRQGMAGVIFAPGKSAEQIAGVASRLMTAAQDVLTTRRAAPGVCDVATVVSGLVYRDAARTASYQAKPRELTQDQ